MKRLLPLVALLFLGAAAAVAWFARPTEPAVNPDPNHTHADFLVVVDGEPLDFSDDAFMTGASTEDHARDPSLSPLRQFLHLHDGLGTVIHRHKPGLTLQDFFDSIHVGFTAECVLYRAPLERDPACSDHPWRMVVSGQEQPFSLNVGFQDLDRILITNAKDEDALARDWAMMGDDACLYSRTCPERGDPPAENCVADPTVPCVAFDE